MKSHGSINVLALSRYGQLGASSRLRIWQYVPYLESRGIKVTAAPLQSDNLVSGAYYGSMSLPTIACRYLHRLKVLLDSNRRYDLLWIEKEVLPWLPVWLERSLMPWHIPYVVDYDDAVFHGYDQHPSPLVRILYGRKIDRVMRHAAVVVAGSGYLAERARRSGARRVVDLPTVVDLNRYRVRSNSAGQPFTIGWIGSPYTQAYLNIIQGSLRDLCRHSDTRLILVGADRVDLPGIRVDIRAWSEETEVPDISDFDVGIMALPDRPFERGKCGYKLVQYMACGKPVVASPVGANRQIVDDGVTGFLAHGEADWTKALTMLREDEHLRKRMGRAGRKVVEARYCMEVTAPRFESVLREAAEKTGR